jgi:hypothetical protein
MKDAKTSTMIRGAACCLWLIRFGVCSGREERPSDFHVFLHLNTFLGGRPFHDDNVVKEAVKTLFASQADSFYDAGIQKLVPLYDMCLSNGGNFVEN